MPTSIARFRASPTLGGSLYKQRADGIVESYREAARITDPGDLSNSYETGAAGPVAEADAAADIPAHTPVVRTVTWPGADKAEMTVAGVMILGG